MFCEFPCIFPCYQGIGRGDRFAPHWFKSKSRLEAENAALRHQLAVLRRKVRGRVQLTNDGSIRPVDLVPGISCKSHINQCFSGSPDAAKLFSRRPRGYIVVMNAPRDHHFIPAFYLKHWAGPDGKLIEHSRKSGKLISKPVGPRSTGFERDLYVCVPRTSSALICRKNRGWLATHHDTLSASET